MVTKDSSFAVSDWEVDSIMLNELRLGVHLNEIEPFEFEFNDVKISVLPTGDLDNWPNDLEDHAIIQMDAMMQGVSRERARAMQFGLQN